MNQLYNITFSPTGTSLYVAQQIAEAFDSEPTLIDLCEEITEDIQIEQESVCIFSVPCYGGRIPLTAAERLSHIHGMGTPAIVCVTFGNRAFEDALLELADCAEASGFRVTAGCAVATEHNIMHIFGAGRPDSTDQRELQQFSIAVAQNIKNGKTARPVLPGNRPYKERHTSITTISVDENKCISCGLCALKCPVKAISENGLHVDENVCINCMRCIKICPEKSRSISEEYVAALIQKLGSACKERKENEFYR